MKRVLIELINNELSGGSSAEIGLKLSDLISQSFRWWHSQFGGRDPFGLDRWRIESVEVREIPPKGR
ncbi:MAG: hypothetical protein IH856_18875 [Deltaproteobacteria bacterium]|nr:hypothetical protein [Deltaproteobacteria bacterium]MCZ6449934.1 hypothetical protein [Deltaproteobacteria bacterium]MCZ6546532.1 hypothetical protein [Deltaproteobacteria bacterium]MCZ6564366.1 hypothetical protein [Deltaproteobacteria bacterium]MCZ6621518.1 hypothetical protein [Deltaproteobacteria bacterium]